MLPKVLVTKVRFIRNSELVPIFALLVRDRAVRVRVAFKVKIHKLTAELAKAFRFHAFTLHKRLMIATKIRMENPPRFPIG